MDLAKRKAIQKAGKSETRQKSLKQPRNIRLSRPKHVTRDFLNAHLPMRIRWAHKSLMNISYRFSRRLFLTSITWPQTAKHFGWMMDPRVVHSQSCVLVCSYLTKRSVGFLFLPISSNEPETDCMCQVLAFLGRPRPSQMQRFIF